MRKMKLYLLSIIGGLLIISDSFLIASSYKEGVTKEEKSNTTPEVLTLVNLKDYNAGIATMDFSKVTLEDVIMISDNEITYVTEQSPSYDYYDIPLSESDQTLINDLLYELGTDLPISFIYGMINTECSYDSSEVGELGDTGWLQIREKYYYYYAKLAGIPEEQFSGHDLYCSIRALVGFYEDIKARYNLQGEDLLAFVAGCWNYGEERFNKRVNRTGTYMYEYNTKIFNYMESLVSLN